MLLEKEGTKWKNGDNENDRKRIEKGTIKSRKQAKNTEEKEEEENKDRHREEN